MIGRTLGRYRILEKLGEGGMGQVWKAADTHLPRSVALKLLRESLLTSTDARRRFLREATAACKLDHPAIATVHDADEADGQVLIAYQFVDGETIADRIARGPLPIAEAVQLARQAAEGLAHAHAQGVLHRDISSRNLMVTSDRRVKIVDFGLAQADEFSRVTSSSTLVGTAGYIAPEVIRTQEWSERSDVYALGVVLFEMLTGRLPFEGPLESQVYAKMHGDPDVVSDQRAEVPQELDRIVRRTLEREPEDRIASAEALGRQLVALEASGVLPATGGSARASAGRAETTPGTGAGVLRRLRRVGRTITARRNRIAAITALSATLIVAVLGVLTLRNMRAWFGSASSKISSVAILPFVNESEDSEENDYRALGLGEIINAKLFELSELRIVPWVTSRRYVNSDKSLPDLADEFRVDALVVGTFAEDLEHTQVTVALVDRSGFQTWTNSFEGSADDFLGLANEIALGVATSLKGTLTSVEKQAIGVDTTIDQDAYDLYMQGAYALEAADRTGIDDALALFDRAAQIEPELVEAEVGIGAAHMTRYYYGWAGGYASLNDAESHFLRALTIHPESILARRGLISVYAEKGVSEKCLQVATTITPRNVQDVEALQAIGYGFMLGGLPRRGVPLFERAAEIDPANESAQYFLTSGRAWAGQYEAAIASGQSFLRRFGEDPETLTWVGFSHHALGALDSAETSYTAAMRLFGSESNHFMLLWMGSCFEQLGKADSARAVWTRGKTAVEALLAAYPDNTRLRTILAGFYGGLNDKVNFLETVDALLTNEAILGFPSWFRSWVAWGFVRFGDIKTAASIMRAMPENDHAEWFTSHGWWSAYGIPDFVDHPDFAEAREYLEERYRLLDQRYGTIVDL